MPKIKVDQVVSFSTEDPVHMANNILSSDSYKKWKCQTPGEKSASIVLQLEKASIISGIDIGSEHAAYVEVLVSRSGAADSFKVLLVMSSFMSPLEARQSTNVNKVRMFGYNELQSPERDQKWDRVKIVCTQPFNRHVQYGLSFVTLHSSDGKDTGAAGAVAPLKLGNFALRPSSPDKLSAGSLFARRKELASDVTLTAAAAIREASSASASVQSSPMCKPRLKETTTLSSKPNTPSNNTANRADTPKSRNRNELLYTKDEEEPVAKIDKLIEQKNIEMQEKQVAKEEVKKKDKQKSDKQLIAFNGKGEINSSKPRKNSSKQGALPSSSSDVVSDRPVGDTNKRKISEKDVQPSPPKKRKPEKQTKSFNKLLEGVTVVISGIQNPERATIRSEALEMGAKYKSDWDGGCTHLICAFINTPKFQQVKGKGKIVNRLWIKDCHSKRKRLPWRRYALDRKDLAKEESEDEIWEHKEKSPDIEVIYSREKDPMDTKDKTDSTELLEKAESKATQSCFSADTDEESIHPQSKHSPPELPDFLANKVLYIDTELSQDIRSLLSRYIIAFNGLLVDEPSDVVDYAVSSSEYAEVLKTLCPDAQVVSADWIWECHNAKHLVSADSYKL